MTTMTRVVTLALSLICVAHPTVAQTVTSTTGAINGTVSDSTKLVLPGVTVTLSGPALMGTSVAVTDQNGRFRFSSVPIGEFKLTFELGAIALPSGRDTPAIMHADTVWSSGYPNDIVKAEYNATLSNRLFLLVRRGAMKSFWYRDFKSSRRQAGLVTGYRTTLLIF